MFRPHFFFYLCIHICIFQLFPHSAFGRWDKDGTHYVADNLVINIKDQLEKPYSVVAVVQSDDQVKIIEENNNYFKIETADGKQGWIAKQYIKTDIPKSLMIKQLRQDLALLKEQLATKAITAPEGHQASKTMSSVTDCAELQIKLKDAENKIAALVEEKKDLVKNLTELSSSVAQSAQPTDNLNVEQLEQTPETYALLSSEYEKRGKQITELQKSLAKLEDRTRFLWFGAGAAVFIIGLLVGKSANRKKNKFMY